MKKSYLVGLVISSLLLTPISARAETRMSGNGYHSGTITYNGQSFAFTNSFSRSGNSIRTACSTGAHIQRQHNTVSAYFSTYNYGYVYGYSVQNSITCSGISYSNYADCPYGSSQVSSLVSASARIIMYASTTTPSDISVHY